MTPTVVRVALHYYLGGESDFEEDPKKGSPVVRDAVRTLVDAGLLNLTGESSPRYRKTAGLDLWIDEMMTTPFPIAVWQMPTDEESAARANGRAALADIATTMRRMAAPSAPGE